MIRSTSSGFLPARSIASLAAGRATSLVAQFSGACQRVLMPLLASILFTKSGICLNRSRSMSFVTSISGTYLAVDTIVA